MEKWKNMNKQNKLVVLLVVGMIVMMLFNSVIMNSFKSQTTVVEVTYNEFIKQLENKNVEQVQVETDDIYFSLIEPIEEDQQEEDEGLFSFSLPQTTTSDKASVYYYTVRMDDQTLVDRLYESGAEFSQVKPEETPVWLSLLISVGIPLLFFFLLSRFLMKRLEKSGGMGGGSMSFGKSNAKVYVKSVDGIRFKDVAGEDEAKEALTEIVDFLHNPGKYKEIGAVMPKGALLVGPPGTGKTLLAKAVAGEANVPFFSISGSEFVEMFVGMGAAKVRDLFKQAGEKAPCIVFIDEIDTIGKKRDSSGFAGNDEREQTLNQLLTEMDGFDASKGVVILGACNRPEILDPALLRPGRFDRRIPVELPDLIGREEILKVHAKKVRLSNDVDLKAIARTASGASGADLANMINEAALHAVRHNRQYVCQVDLEESIETVIAGYKKKNKVLTDKEKLIVAYHEIGHALVAALQTNSAPVTKITIIPRTSGALGYTMQVDEDNHNLMTKEELENKIATLTGGRVAEQIVFGSVTTGASNDIEQATKLARAMVTRFGMQDEIGMVAMEVQQNKYLGGDTALSCSDATAEQIDKMVISLVKEQYKKAENLLRTNMGKLHDLSKHLYENEVITGDEFMSLLGYSEQVS